MDIKSSQSLVNKALEEVKTINHDQAHEMFTEDQCNLIDIRDVRELERDGRVENSYHIPRGMLEFWMDPNSSYFQKGKIDQNKEMILFCAGGVRSALAVKALKHMGYKKISHIEGGFSSMSKSKFKIV